MRYYTKTDEWVLVSGTKATIGLSEFAVNELGDIVFVELPQVGEVFRQNDAFAAIESVKAASDIYIPVSGKVVSVNEALEDAPELINENPLGSYLIEIEDFDAEELKGLMTEAEYEEKRK